MNKKLENQWREAIDRCGGVEKFEKDVLPHCNESVQVVWEWVKKELYGDSKETHSQKSGTKYHVTGRITCPKCGHAFEVGYKEECGELERRIASYDPQMVAGQPQFARSVYNECRRICGLPEIKFNE